MFGTKHRSKFLFLEGCYIHDCVEQEPVIITKPKPKPKPKHIVKNPCVNCKEKPVNEKFFIVSSISRCGDGYILSLIHI